MKLFRGCLFVIAGLILVAPAAADEQQAEEKGKPAQSSGLAIGFNLETLQNDFGLELGLTTPYFAGESMALRLRGGIAWAIGIPDGETKEDWLLYSPMRIGFVGSWGFAANMVRLYSEAGCVVVLSIQDVSSNTFAGVGGYGLFGFEFFAGDRVPVTYFIEGGGMGTSATADKMITDPSLANGFFATVGLRRYF